MTKHTVVVTGGIEGGRVIDAGSTFEVAVERALGSWIKGSHENGVALWSALTNTIWAHADGESIGYSFRAAGDLIAAITGEGDYLTWYCEGPIGVVSQHIAEAMSREGWQVKGA